MFPLEGLKLILERKKVLHVGLRLNIALHYCQKRKLLRHLDCIFGNEDLDLSQY
jgi:hypothetical protein